MKKEFKIKKDGSLLTPVFRVTFPKVFEPDDDGRYTIGMIFDKEVDFDALETLVNQTIKTKWGKKIPKGLQLPILDGDESTRSDSDTVAGKMYINGKCGKYRPGLVDENRNPIEDPEDFYPGCYARAVINCYGWKYMGKHGVSVAVRNIQKVSDGEPLIGRVRADDDFDDLPQDDEVEDL